MARPSPSLSLIPPLTVIKILQELLAEWQAEGQGNKVLIFSMSLKILSLVKELFEADGRYKYVCLDGATPADRSMYSLLPLLGKSADEGQEWKLWINSIMMGNALCFSFLRKREESDSI